MKGCHAGLSCIGEVVVISSEGHGYAASQEMPSIGYSNVMSTPRLRVQQTVLRVEVWSLKVLGQ